MAARPVLRALRDAMPEAKLFLSTTTDTGQETARAALKAKECDAVFYFPLDAPLPIKRVLRALQPDALLMLETELWPNVLHLVRESGAQVFLVGRCFGAVHWPVAHGEDPGSLFAINAGEIICEPLVLFVVLVVFVAAVHGAEWSTVGDESLVLLGKGLVSLDIVYEGYLGAVCEVGLSIQRDEVGKAIVE